MASLTELIQQIAATRSLVQLARLEQEAADLLAQGHAPSDLTQCTYGDGFAEVRPWVKEDGEDVLGDPPGRPAHVPRH